MSSSSVIEPVTAAAEARFQLRIPMLKMLTSKEELALARAASASAPDSARLRWMLADQLLRADHFDEVVRLLGERDDNDVRLLNVLSTALLGRETAEDDHRALEVAGLAVAESESVQERALTTTELAKVYRRLGETDRAEALLTQALELDPGEKDAYKRMFQLKLERDVNEALRFAEETVAGGERHARVLGTLPLALTMLGRLEEAREAEGAREFLVAFDPEPPEGWESREAFEAALTAEALNHPDTRFNRHGVASVKTWRLDEPALQRTRCFQQLQRLVQREVERYARSLPAHGHAWVEAMPKEAVLRNWTVIVEGDGHEVWHVHQNGWMSGVYYIHVPDHIAQGTGHEGCIAFGLPETTVGAEAAAAFGEKLVRPHTGLMMMFPSHVFHRTYPHFGSGRRICYAFDIIPAEAAV